MEDRSTYLTLEPMGQAKEDRDAAAAAALDDAIERARMLEGGSNGLITGLLRDVRVSTKPTTGGVVQVRFLVDDLGLRGRAAIYFLRAALAADLEDGVNLVTQEHGYLATTGSLGSLEDILRTGPRLMIVDGELAESTADGVRLANGDLLTVLDESQQQNAARALDEGHAVDPMTELLWPAPSAMQGILRGLATKDASIAESAIWYVRLWCWPTLAVLEAMLGAAEVMRLELAAEAMWRVAPRIGNPAVERLRAACDDSAARVRGLALTGLSGLARAGGDGIDRDALDEEATFRVAQLLKTPGPARRLAAQLAGRLRTAQRSRSIHDALLAVVREGDDAGVVHDAVLGLFNRVFRKGPVDAATLAALERAARHDDPQVSRLASWARTVLSDQ